MPTTIAITPARKRTRASASAATPGRKKSKTRALNVSRNMVKVGQAFPKTIRTVLRYVESGSLTVGSSSYNQIFYKCNGLYDPLDSLGGHQPYGFDQYTAIYNHYKVFKSRVIVQWHVSTGARHEGLIVGVNITPGSSDSDTPQTKMEKQDGRTNYRWISPSGDSTAITNKSWTPKAYFGIQKEESELSAAVGADPAELSHYCVWASNPAGAETFVFYTVTVEYYTEFSEPKSLGGS